MRLWNLIFLRKLPVQNQSSNFKKERKNFRQKNYLITFMISRDQLLHLKIQAAMREKHFNEDQMKYLGVREGEHWYLVANEYEVPVKYIDNFEQVNDAV